MVAIVSYFRPKTSPFTPSVAKVEVVGWLLQLTYCPISHIPVKAIVLIDILYLRI